MGARARAEKSKTDNNQQHQTPMREDFKLDISLVDPPCMRKKNTLEIFGLEADCTNSPSRSESLCSFTLELELFLGFAMTGHGNAAMPYHLFQINTSYNWYC